MKPLGLKMVPPKIVEKPSGFPILLLIVLMIHFLKPSPNLSPSPGFPCPERVYVQVEGDFRQPGVYLLCMAVHEERAISEAATWKWPCRSFDPPHTAKLTSGSKIQVFPGGQRCKACPGDMNPYYKVSLGIPLSVNREQKEAFTAVPGVGEKLAAAIVRERDRRGGFKHVKEIAEVPGVGRALYKRIEPYLDL